MIKYKATKLEGEYKRLPQALRQVVRELDELCTDKKFPSPIVTCVLRTETENKIVKGVPTSLHLELRAVDLRSTHYTPEQLEVIDAWLRARCPKKAYEVITKPHGSGPHIHLALRNA